MPQPSEAGPVGRSKAALLDRIADTLGVQVDAFHDRGDERLAPHVEAMDLLTAFAGIEDPTVRRRCLMLVRAASRTLPGSDAGS